MRSQRAAVSRVLVALSAIAIVAIAAVAYFSYSNPGGPANIVSSSQSTCTVPAGGNGTANISTFSTICSVTGTVVRSSDTFITNGCVSSSDNDLELRIVSDSPGHR